MRTSLIALGLVSLGLAQCSAERGLLVGGERGGDDGEAGDMNTSGTGSGTSGGNGGTENTGGTQSSGGQNSGGTQNRGGSGAEAGEDPGTGGTGGTDRGGTDSGGTDSGGSAGEAGSVARGGTGGGAGTGGMDSGGRAGANTGGVGGSSDVDCAALEREYRERLAAAQTCSPILTVEQCTREMPDDLLCGCPTFVNPAREADIARLLEIIEKAQSCRRICPAIVCPAVRRGTCAADAIVGTGRGRCIAQP